jgi:glycosyltransferase involved in cell wall biosynthesis
VKILVTASFAPSLINFRAAFNRALLYAGHQVIATAAEADLVVSQTLAEWGVHYTALPLQRTGLNPLADRRYMSALRGIIEREQPDAVLAYTHKPVIYSALAVGAMASPPRVYPLITGLGFAFMTGSGWKQTLARRVLITLYRRASRHFTGVFFQNPDDLALFRKLRLIRPETPVCVVRGSGIDLAGFPFVPLAPSSQHLAPRFLLIARLLSDKGIREYVAAARIIRKSRPAAEFHLVGPVDPNPAAIALSEVEGWVAEGVISYHGSKSDVRPYLRDCSVYVLPSYREGTPRTVLEAMATGRAVITTDAPGCRETIFNAGAPDADGVRTGDNGFLVPVKSVDALVAAMRQVIENPALAVTMGKSGRRLAEEHYDVHKVNRQMMEFMGLAAKPPVSGE